MKKIALILWFLLMGLTTQGQVFPFDSGWKFMEDASEEASKASWNDSDWKEVSLPHDFIIERDFTGRNGIGPFLQNIKDSISTGNTPGGIGWYRKHFRLPDFHTGQKVYMVFDGVSVLSDVWLNNHHLGFHPNGYTPFYYDLTPYLHASNKENVIVVKANNTGDNSRWYCGGGIYRHVYLIQSGLVHFPVWGIQVKTDAANVNFTVPVYNETKHAQTIEVTAKVIDKEGKTVGIQRLSGKLGLQGDTLQLSCPIENPHWWSPDTPYLYQAEVTVTVNKKVTDRYTTSLGMRTLSFSADKGFLLNGQPLKLHGACIHHDNGILGVAAFDKAEARRVRILKENGFNAIRTAHNRPSAAFLHACDSLGMFVIDESFDMWLIPKRDNDYHLYFKEWADIDQAAIVQCDRNHPSVLMWSIGNEIPGDQTPEGVEISKRLAGVVRANDTTRPVTDGVCAFAQREGLIKDELDEVYKALDVWGYNYRLREIAADHLQFPHRVMVSTESFPRETLLNDQIEQSLSCYLGSFVWTGMDYIGEVGIGNAVYTDNEELKFARPTRLWPWYVSFCGDIDLIGNKKPQSYYRDVVWNRSDMEMMVTPYIEGKHELVSKWGWFDELPSWNWKGYEGRSMTVRVYTRCDYVALFINGRITGKSEVLPNSLIAEFRIPYAAGELKAVGYRNGKAVVEKVLNTQKGQRIALIAEDHCVSPNELVYIQIRIVDEEGKLIPEASVPLKLQVSGKGKLLASGNGAPDDMESFRHTYCKVWHGCCLAVLQATGQGTMTLTVSAEGLPEEKVEIQIK